MEYFYDIRYKDIIISSATPCFRNRVHPLRSSKPSHEPPEPSQLVFSPVHYNLWPQNIQNHNTYMNFSSPLQSHLKTNDIKRLLTTKEFRYLIFILYHISNSRSNKLENFERWERDYFHNSLVLHFSYNC